jgi:hypothetical protein
MSERRNPMNLIVQRLPPLETGFRGMRGNEAGGVIVDGGASQ